jgi:hypothetical protein
MRNAPYINDLWNQGGPFIGPDGKPHTIVTVQRPWEVSDPHVVNGDEDHIIHPTNVGGKSRKRGVPIRWYQKEDNSQTEEIIPNIKSVSIDRSLDQPASTCNIELYNQWMYDNGAVPIAYRTQGNRALAGHFTPTRGTYPDANVRWNQEANIWEDTLIPNAILRTYQGYGGHDKTLAECLEDGNLILTGVWLVDEITVGTDGMLNLRCRDMGKLLVDQQLYPPLVPKDKYPLEYFRWVYTNRKVTAAAKTITTRTTIAIPPGNKRAIFRDSAVDRWYPADDPGSDIPSGGFLLHGHKATHCLDNNPATYALSVGNSAPNKPFATDWWEFTCGEYMNAVFVHPWGGNYTMYVSVMENGVWQGTNTVPYDHTPLVGSQPRVVDTGADIPYVAQFGVPWETGREFVLPRAYNAQRVRVSFRNHTYSGIGPWFYRVGMREFRIRATTSIGSITKTTSAQAVPYFFAAAHIRNPDNLNSVGYITVSTLGQIDAFGDCRVLKKTGGNNFTNANKTWIALTNAADGYWVMGGDGTVTAFGAAEYFGSPHDDGIGKTGGQASGTGSWWQAICPTPDNDGYWCVGADGRIRSYGAATTYTDLGLTVDEDMYVAGAYPCPVGAHGLFIAIAGTGEVIVKGSATWYGDWDETSLTFPHRLASVIPTMDSDGYWLVTTSGRVDAKGAAVDYGQITNPVLDDNALMVDQLLPIPSEDGYLIVRLGGAILPFGNAQYFGAPIPGSTGQLRSDGNYLDYADIIKDLALWSGFNLFDPDLPANEEPVVFGNIESTSSYSDEQLPDEMFDKRPVIDAMNEIKEAVGYILFIDDEGGLRFHSPNFWSYGNFYQEDGEWTDQLPEIDESVNLMDHRVNWNDESLRSLIIIASEDPDEVNSSTTVTTKIVPQTARGLRGLLKPAMWVNGWFQSKVEQQIMAELIAMHIWFAQRLGQVSCVANPAIQIDDQVRIYERQTSDVFVHYVRGINTRHDLDSGSYEMTLTTHWLGTGDDWAVTNSPEYTGEKDYFVVSDDLLRWIAHKGGRTNVDGMQTLGTTSTDTTDKGFDPVVGDPGEGAAS